jgi:trk system potassium uptake protein TrkH
MRLATTKCIDYLAKRPGHLLVFSFAGVIAVGTLLLALPAASTGPHLSVIDALFTSASATCVTGLAVVDTGTQFSTFGQLIVLGLIQVGGLGIMTISTFIALALGRNIGLRGEFAIGEMVGEEQSRMAFRLVKFIVLLTLAIELLGALLLAQQFQSTGMTWGRAAYVGFFHSVSAFCNAGFSLFPDSLTQYSQVPLIPLTVSGLIILGGLGFTVQFAFWGKLLKHPKRLPFHVRLVAGATLALIVFGTVAIWALERPGSLAELTLGESWLQAFFQSVTTRTAGFNSMDLRSLSHASLLLMMVLMFIGAAPGSTGGGVKVTTFAVLYAVVSAVLSGRESVQLRGRRIDPTTVLRAMALICLSLGAVAVVSFVLMLTQNISADVLLFEAVSAFGTVGLSLGVTPELTGVGKLSIACLMFIGRVGPLTFLVMIRPRRVSAIDYPQANVMIG